MTFDSLFSRVYDYERYNCMHFTVEAWRLLFGVDLSFLTKAVVPGGTTHTLTAISRIKKFVRLQKPQSPCLCLMRGVSAEQTHIGTFLDGRVLHINESGVQYFPPEVIYPLFKRVLFYEYRHTY